MEGKGNTLCKLAHATVIPKRPQVTDEGGLPWGVSKVCPLHVTSPGPAAEFRPTVTLET